MFDCILDCFEKKVIHFYWDKKLNMLSNLTGAQINDIQLKLKNLRNKLKIGLESGNAANTLIDLLCKYRVNVWKIFHIFRLKCIYSSILSIILKLIKNIIIHLLTIYFVFHWIFREFILVLEMNLYICNEPMYFIFNLTVTKSERLQMQSRRAAVTISTAQTNDRNGQCNEQNGQNVDISTTTTDKPSSCRLM